MRRKIALGITALMTVLLMILRAKWIPALNDLSIGSLDVAHFIPFLLVAITVILAVLCYQKRPTPCEPHGNWQSPCGWFAAFSGTILALTTLYNVVCLIVYAEVPPPNDVILNQIDHIAMILMLVFGVVGGAFLVVLGFKWMANLKMTPKYLPWLSIAPTLWMWFRLARYEISYASTVDISENVYDFSTMIFMSLFLIQLARATMRIGKPPTNTLTLFAMCTTIVTVSGIPSEFTAIPEDASLSVLLILVVDIVIGLFAAVYAVMLVCNSKTLPVSDEKAPVKAVDTEEYEVTDDTANEDELDAVDEEQPLAQTWEAPAPAEPVEPPFVIDNPIPNMVSPKPPVTTSTNNDIDDIIAQIDNDF